MLMPLKKKYTVLHEPESWKNKPNKHNVPQWGRGGDGHGSAKSKPKKGESPARASSGRSGSPYGKRR